MSRQAGLKCNANRIESSFQRNYHPCNMRCQSTQFWKRQSLPRLVAERKGIHQKTKCPTMASATRATRTSAMRICTSFNCLGVARENALCSSGTSRVTSVSMRESHGYALLLGLSKQIWSANLPRSYHKRWQFGSLPSRICLAMSMWAVRTQIVCPL